jgi:hypothetical protein
MKPSIVSGLVACGVSILFTCIVAGAGQTKTTKHEPNSGPIGDADAAKEIAKVVLSRLLTPEDVQHKEFFDATLKEGVWTVHCREPKDRESAPIMIQIRQKSGAIIKYEDPNV